MTPETKSRSSTDTKSVIRRFAATLVPAALAGGLFLMAVGRANDPSLSRWGLFLLGALFGVAISGLIRLFRIAPWGYPWAGLFCGLAPPGIFFDSKGGQEDRGGFLLVAALLGFLLGLIEWARARGPQSTTSSARIKRVSEAEREGDSA